MALADAAATGVDDPLNREAPTEGKAGEAAQGELAFRDRQLTRMREEILDLEEAEDGVTLNDLTLDDFVADLLRYVQQHRAALEAAPLGIQAVVDTGARDESAPGNPAEPVRPGAIFCLKQGGDPSARTPNRLWPYFLVHVRGDGSVRYTFRQARQCLALFRALASGRPEAAAALEDAFDRETEHGRRMERYDGLLAAALRSISGTFRNAELGDLARKRGATLIEKPARPDPGGGFTLVTWLVILDEKRRNGARARQP